MESMTESLEESFKESTKGSMKKGSYEDLHVWRESILYATEVHLAAQGLPESERSVLGDPMRRAAASVATGIAEGQALGPRREFLRQLGLARAALARTHTLLVLSEQLGYVTPARLQELDQGRLAVSRPLNGLIGSLQGGRLE